MTWPLAKTAKKRPWSPKTLIKAVTQSWRSYSKSLQSVSDSNTRPNTRVAATARSRNSTRAIWPCRQLDAFRVSICPLSGWTTSKLRHLLSRQRSKVDIKCQRWGNLVNRNAAIHFWKASSIAHWLITVVCRKPRYGSGITLVKKL